MPDDTQTEKSTPSLTDSEFLKIARLQKTTNVNKLLNALQESIPESKQDAGSELGATTETAESA